MLDRRQYSRKSHVLHVGVRPELQPVETHRHAPRYLPAKSAGEEIWNLEAAVVDSIAAAAGESLRMKNLVRKRDILAGIASDAFELAAGELAFSAQIHPARRHRRFTQRFSEIQQLDPAAVPETPLWIREVFISACASRCECPR